MTINDVEVRQADNNEVTIGTVSEYDIKVTECQRECDIDGEPKKVTSAWIGGTLVVDVNGNEYVRHPLQSFEEIKELINFKK